MGTFRDSVTDFLGAHGFHSSDETPEGVSSYEVIRTSSEDGKLSRTVILLKAIAGSPEEAEIQSEAAWEHIKRIQAEEEAVIISEDRWNTRNDMTGARLLAHMQIFFPIYARNCEVRRIDKKTAAEFLERTHSYGDASCRYRYGLYLKRHTGHVADELQDGLSKTPLPGTLVAVATFSNARKWIKGEKVIRSYEWTRYASLPGLRVNGGMGKLLKEFIKEAQPDDIMTYADLEWSEGGVYEQLGFSLEGRKSPVMFRIDELWRRFPVKTGMPGNLFYQNFGSNKFRLKLTDYR